MILPSSICTEPKERKESLVGVLSQQRRNELVAVSEFEQANLGGGVLGSVAARRSALIQITHLAIFTSPML